MRTKTLLLTAALSAAGLAMTQAQSVFSVNIVGYVNVDVPAGFSMIANQLDNGNGNMLNDLIPSADIGTTIYKFDATTGFSPSTFISDWQPNLSLAPGEGAFINVGTATTLTFVGEVKTGTSTVSIPSGFSIKSSVLPISEKLEDSGFPASIGDTVYFFRNGGYVASTFISDFQPEAKPAVGESFFVNKGTAADWTRTFTVN
jgi:hypothetical protein